MQRTLAISWMILSLLSTNSSMKVIQHPAPYDARTGHSITVNRFRYELQATVSQRVGGSGSWLAQGATPVNLAPAYVELTVTAERLFIFFSDGCAWWRFVVASLPSLALTASVRDTVGLLSGRWCVTTMLLSLSATTTLGCCVWRPVSPLTREFCSVRRRSVLLCVCLLTRRGRMSSLRGPSTTQVTLVTAVSACSVRVIVHTVLFSHE